MVMQLFVNYDEGTLKIGLPIIFGVRYIKPMNIDGKLAIIYFLHVIDMCNLSQGSIKD